MTKVEIKTLIDQMFQAGSHFGYSKSRRHPSTKPYIFGAKNKVEIIDLEKSAQLLAEAKEFVAGLAAEGKQMLFVGSKPEAAAAVKDAASSVGQPYMTERWIGGTLTNFSGIKKRIARLLELTAKKEKEEFGMYTKKERLLLDREMAKLERNFGGIRSMKELPKALFIVDPKAEHNAVAEALKEGIPTVALASSDCNIKDIDYPIVANDASASSVALFVGEIAAAYEEGARNKKPAGETTGEKTKDTEEKKEEKVLT